MSVAYAIRDLRLAADVSGAADPPDPGAATRPVTVVVRDGVIDWVGPDPDSPSTEHTIDGRGGWVTPAFVDAHLHTAGVGQSLSEVDLAGCRSADEMLERIAVRTAAGVGDPSVGGLVAATGWDESIFTDPHIPDAAELSRAAGGAYAIAHRVDAHSAVVSTELLALARSTVPGLADMAGYSGAGVLSRDALGRVSSLAADLTPPEARRRWTETALRHYARHGIVSFHENAAPHLCPRDDLAVITEVARELGLQPVLYWGAPCDADRDAAARDGLAGYAGDFNIDGAFGSRTAALLSDYCDCAGHTGYAYLTADQIAAHLVDCTERGLQGGFHVIGDAGLARAHEGIETAVGECDRRFGPGSFEARRHRLEHVELPDRDTVALLARHNVTASVQPVFDALWGGPDKLYAARLGERWRTSNPIGWLVEAGVPVAFGSDCPVTPIGPWQAIGAAIRHHSPDQRIDFTTAFDAHTAGGWRAAGIDRPTAIAVGTPADLAVWSRPSRELADTPDPQHTTARLTVSAGRVIHHETEAA